jgi:hypothetical protein
MAWRAKAEVAERARTTRFLANILMTVEDGRQVSKSRRKLLKTRGANYDREGAGLTEEKFCQSTKESAILI